MDVLSDILKVVRLNGGSFYTAEFTSPWAVYTPDADELARLMQTRAESVAVFHILVEGVCWIALDGTEPFKISAGSAIVFPHSPQHELSSRPGLTPEPIVPLLTQPEEKVIPEIKHGGGGRRTRYFCGYLQCDHRFNPLVGAMPPLIVVSPDNFTSGEGAVPDGSAASGEGAASDGGAASDESAASINRETPADFDGAVSPRYAVIKSRDRWLNNTLEHLASEAFKNEPGTPAMLGRLSELLYVEILRRHAAEASISQKGWFAAIKDPAVGRALRKLHADPSRKWTVTELGAEVGVSRSALAQRFAALVGESPMRYLTNWRMQVAKDLLLQGALSLPQIAEQIGYESEVAFSRAFRRDIGTPPATWREHYFRDAGK